jgi:hypothetical protein
MGVARRHTKQAGDGPLSSSHVICYWWGHVRPCPPLCHSGQDRSAMCASQPSLIRVYIYQSHVLAKVSWLLLICPIQGDRVQLWPPACTAPPFFFFEQAVCYLCAYVTRVVPCWCRSKLSLIVAVWYWGQRARQQLRPVYPTNAATCQAITPSCARRCFGQCRSAAQGVMRRPTCRNNILRLLQRSHCS